ncbi:MAG: DUF502 domain-containing protein [Bacteroidota bacterium]
MKAKTFFGKLLNFFVQGIIILAPIGITVYILYAILKFVDELVPIHIPGLGIIIVLFVVTLTGVLASTFIGRPVIAYFNKLINKAHLLKTVINSIKDLLGAFVGKKKKFSEPVLVMMNKESGIEQMGFVTSRELGMIGIPGKKIAVYIPFSFTFTGYMFVVAAENITPLDISSTDAIKFIISGGVIEGDKIMEEGVEG